MELSRAWGIRARKMSSPSVQIEKRHSLIESDGTLIQPERLRMMSAWKSPDDPVEWSVVDETIDHRLAEITAWLREDKLIAGDPEEKGRGERAYLHFRYFCALPDLPAVLAHSKRTQN